MKNNIMKRVIILAFMAFTTFSCCDEEITLPEVNNCEQETEISVEDYETAPNELLNIESIEIEEDCLNITYSSSGCDGSTWVVRLIDSEAIAESLPPQRFLKLSLLNQEECAAYITKSRTFDISNLQVEGNQVLLNFISFEDSVLYEY